MLTTVRKFLKYINGPQLFHLYKAGSQVVSLKYEPNTFERWGDTVIQTINIVWGVGVYTSPVLAIILYRGGYGSYNGLMVLSKLIIGMGIIMTISYVLRGFGRLNNPVYKNFMDTLSAAKATLNSSTKKSLMMYDFDFKEWPIEYSWDDNKINHEKRVSTTNNRSISHGTTIDSIISLPCHIISNVVAYSFAAKMIYPGSIKSMQYFMFSFIQQGRQKLIEDYGGERFKLKSTDANVIDVMFVDRRNSKVNGNTLAICCEGNAAFYEIGIMFTPIEANYSVMGWNHPGFGGSTGAPYPEQEKNAIDVVIQFAIHHLGFQPHQILLYGWSIGGFTSSWAATAYSDVAGLILDATFDDILPLAIPRMPSALTPIVHRVIREHFNLNVFENVAKFNGPLTIIRRTEDEIICTEEGDLSTNRGNFLLAKVFQKRYPNLLDEKRRELLDSWLNADHLQQALIMDQHHIDKELCQSILASYIEDNGSDYPLLIGDGLQDTQKSNLLLFLADKYMMSYRSTHCSSLPANLFRFPWTVAPSDSGFVKL